MSEYSRLRVDVWFHYGCPFSYAHSFIVRRFAEIYGPEVEIYWHPNGGGEPYVTADRRQFSLSQWEWDRFVVPLANEIGIKIAYPDFGIASDRPVALALAASQVGKFEVMHASLFHAYFVSGLDIDRLENLNALARKAGFSFDYQNVSRSLQTQISPNGEVGHEQMSLRGLPFTLLSREQHDSEPRRPVQILGAAPLRHFHAAVGHLFPEGYRVAQSQSE